jgi:hypothetical protein
MVAHEGSHSFVTGKHQSPAWHPEGIYPRLELIRRDGTREMRRPLNNYATHEWWAASGEAIYYCSQGHIAARRWRAGAGIRLLHGNGTWHAHCTRDERYFIVDGSLKSMGLGWWRGCVSVVRFYNDQTKKLCDLLTYNPIVDGWTPENPCPYHIDPHPALLGRSVGHFTTTVAGRVDVAMAPVQQLIDATM